MIPKIIHYCWFGEGPMNETIVKCIKSWEKFLPEYKIMRWDEKSFDLTSNQFVNEAFQKKKYAFVSDYVRLYALKNYGGIYLDTDVEVVKSLNSLLHSRAFTGVERGEYCVTGTIGAEKGHPWIGALLEYYHEKHFILPDGKLDELPNTVIITNITKEKYNWQEGNKYSELQDGVVIYPFDYLCAKNGMTNEILVTENTYTIHHFNGSWLPVYKQKLSKYVRFLRKLIKYKR